MNRKVKKLVFDYTQPAESRLNQILELILDGHLPYFKEISDVYTEGPEGPDMYFFQDFKGPQRNLRLKWQVENPGTPEVKTLFLEPEVL